MSRQGGKALPSQLFELHRLWWGALPFERSIIPTDICLTIAHFQSIGQPLTMKQLVAELPHSEAGIKQYLRKIERDGWIKREKHPQDGRAVSFQSTDKLMALLDDLATRMRDVLTPPPLKNLSKALT